MDVEEGGVAYSDDAFLKASGPLGTTMELKTCKELGGEWEPRPNLLRDRVSPLAGHNLFTPAQMPLF